MKIAGFDHGVTYNTIENIVIIGSPLADAGGPYTIAEGDALTLNGSVSLVPTGQTVVAYEWRVGNTFGVVTGVNPTISWGDLKSFGVDDSGTYQVSVRVTSRVGSQTFSDIATATLTVLDTPPTLVLNGAPTAEAGSAYTLSLSATDPGDDTIHTWVVNWGDGSSAETYFGNVAVVRHVYQSPANYPIHVAAFDEDGGPYEADTAVMVTPSRSISGDATVDEGAVYTLNLNNPSGADIATWTINWGDGQLTTVVGTATPATHTYADEGFYRIRAETRDTNGQVRSDVGQVLVTVLNVAPTAGLFPTTATVNQGGSLDVTVTAYDPGVEDQLTFELDLDNDGRFEVVSAPTPVSSAVFSVTQSFPRVGSVLVSARVRDDDGGVSDVQTLTVTVNNVGPTIESVDVLSENLFEATPILLRVNASDPGGVEDPLIYEFDFDNDGVFESLSTEQFGRHVYPDDGQYTVNIRVTDSFGASAGTSVVLDVANLNPTATAPAGTGRVEEGRPALFFVGASDPAGEHDPLTVDFDFDDDGVFETPSTFNALTARWEAVVTFADDTFPPPSEDGTIPIAARVRDDDGGETVVTTPFELVFDGQSYVTNPINVFNVAPTIALDGDRNAAEGETYTLNLGQVTDPGTDTVTQYLVNWGDGTEDVYTTDGDVTHVYQGAFGERTIRVMLVDEDGLHPRAGEKTIIVTGAGVVDRTLFIVGGDEDDHVTVNKQGNKLLKVHATFFVDVNFKTFPLADVDRIVVYVYGGRDHVTIAGNIDIPTIIDGGSGDDRLNGGQGPTVIVGSGGDDEVHGGQGRDILIGGSGADRLFGHGGEDILIAGASIFDNNLVQWQALDSLLNEWKRTDADYTTRVGHLQGPTGGLNGSAFLNTTTVGDDAAVDELKGDGDTDWFFALVAGGISDLLKDRKAGEELTQLL